MGIGSFFKKLGKGLLKVAPIATAFIPGVGPVASALLGAGAGAASGAVTGGKKGALIGGLMGGIGGGAGAAMKGASGAANMGGTLASRPITSLAAEAAKGGIKSAITGGLKSAATGMAKNIGGSLLDRIMQPNVTEAAARGLGGVAQTEAHNRGVTLDAMMDADRNRMDLARDRRADEGELWRKLQATDYMKSGGTPRPTTPTLSANGKPFTQFGFGPAPISEGNKAMASTMEEQLLKRLNNPATLSDYESKMEPGKVETAMNWLSPGMSIFSEIMKNRGQQPKPTPTPTAAPPVPTLNVDPMVRLPGQPVGE